MNPCTSITNTIPTTLLFAQQHTTSPFQKLLISEFETSGDGRSLLALGTVPQFLHQQRHKRPTSTDTLSSCSKRHTKFLRQTSSLIARTEALTFRTNRRKNSNHQQTPSLLAPADVTPSRTHQTSDVITHQVYVAHNFQCSLHKQIMYRYYRYMPEGNRPCCKLDRDRAYKLHLDKLRRTRASLDMSTPDIPPAMGQNRKRYVIQKARMEEIQKDNLALYGNLGKIRDRDPVYKNTGQVMYTLQGKWQKEQAYKINQENQRVVRAIQERKPTINRYDMFAHQCDHEYQYQRKSLYKPTIPMGQVIQQKLHSEHQEPEEQPPAPPPVPPAEKKPRKHEKQTETEQPRSGRSGEFFVTSREGNRPKVPTDEDEKEHKHHRKHKHHSSDSDE